MNNELYKRCNARDDDARRGANRARTLERARHIEMSDEIAIRDIMAILL